MDKENRNKKIDIYIDELTSDINSLSSKAKDVIKNKYKSDERPLREIFIEIDDILKAYSNEDSEEIDEKELVEEKEVIAKPDNIKLEEKTPKLIKKQLRIKPLVILLIIIIVIIIGITIAWILIR